MNFRQLDDYKQEKDGRKLMSTADPAVARLSDTESENLVELMSRKDEDETPGEVKVRLNQVSNAIAQMSAFSDDFVRSSGVLEFMWNVLTLSPDVALFGVPGLLHMLGKSPLFVDLFVAGNPTDVCSWLMSPSKEIRRAALKMVNEMMESRVACEWVLSSGAMENVAENANELVEMFNTNPRLGEDVIAMYGEILWIFHSLAFQMGSELSPFVSIFVNVLESTVNCEYSFRFNISVIKILLLMSANGFMEPLLSSDGLRGPVLGLLFDDVARPCYPYLIEFYSEIVRKAPEDISEQCITQEVADRCMTLFRGERNDQQLTEACLHLFINLSLKNPVFVGLASRSDELWEVLHNLTEHGNAKIQEATQWFIWTLLGAASAADLGDILQPVIPTLSDSFLSENPEFLLVVIDSVSNIMRTIEPNVHSAHVFQEFIDTIMPLVPDLFGNDHQDVAERAHVLWETYGAH